MQNAEKWMVDKVQYKMHPLYGELQWFSVIISMDFLFLRNSVVHDVTVFADMLKHKAYLITILINSTVLEFEIHFDKK